MCKYERKYKCTSASAGTRASSRTGASAGFSSGMVVMVVMVLAAVAPWRARGVLDLGFLRWDTLEALFSHCFHNGFSDRAADHV
eukprot:12924416-Prorocentrum_lima.AAC.1